MRKDVMVVLIVLILVLAVLVGCREQLGLGTKKLVGVKEVDIECKDKYTRTVTYVDVKTDEEFTKDEKCSAGEICKDDSCVSEDEAKEEDIYCPELDCSECPAAECDPCDECPADEGGDGAPPTGELGPPGGSGVVIDGGENCCAITLFNRDYEAMGTTYSLLNVSSCYGLNAREDIEAEFVNPLNCVMPADQCCCESSYSIGSTRITAYAQASRGDCVGFASCADDPYPCLYPEEEEDGGIEPGIRELPGTGLGIGS